MKCVMIRMKSRKKNMKSEWEQTMEIYTLGFRLQLGSQSQNQK